MDHDFKMITIIWILLSTNIFFQPELLGKSCFEFIHTEDQVIYTSNFHSNSNALTLSNDYNIDENNANLAGAHERKLRPGCQDEGTG